MKLETTNCVICHNNQFTDFADGFDYQYHVSSQRFQIVRCRQCGHVYQNPRPSLQSAGYLYPKNYYTLTGRHTQSTAPLIAAAKQLVINKRLNFFRQQFKQKGNLLEVGCGDGELLINLQKKYPQFRFTGIDLNFSAITKKRCQDQKINLIQGSIEKISLSKNKFDIIILNQVIEHLWEPALVLKKLQKSLKKNGFISIETPNIDGYDRKIFPRYWGGYYFPRHLNLFSSESLARLLQLTGFKVIKHQQLVAPIIWTFSFHAWLNSGFFTDSNPLCLAFFSLIDWIAIKLGLITSNQKIIASAKRHNI